MYQPFPQQPDRWPADSREHYRQVCGNASRVAALGDSYGKPLLFARNDWMLRDSDAVVAVLDPEHRRGGTHQTVARAIGRVPVIRIDPRARRVTLNTPEPPGH